MATNQGVVFNNQLPISNLDFIDLTQYASQYGPGPLKQYYDYILFDSKVASPGTAVPGSAIKFFQTPNGGTDQLIGATTTYVKQDTDTNMQQAGQLPQGQLMVIKSVQVLVNLTGNLPAVSGSGNNISRPTTQGFTANVTSAMSDLRTILQLGNGVFKIGNRPFMNNPLWGYPTDYGVSGNGIGFGPTAGATLSIDSYATNGFGCGKLLDSPQLLIAGKNFEFDITFPYIFTQIALAYVQYYVLYVGTLYDTVS